MRLSAKHVRHAVVAAAAVTLLGAGGTAHADRFSLFYSSPGGVFLGYSTGYGYRHHGDFKRRYYYHNRGYGGYSRYWHGRPRWSSRHYKYHRPRYHQPRRYYYGHGRVYRHHRWRH